MKNLFCTLVLALGIFVSAQAQNLYITSSVANGVSGTWAIKVLESNGGSANMTVVPNSPDTGTIFDVATPFSIRVADTSISCSGTTFSPVTTSGSGVSCSQTVTWTLIATGGNYYLTIVIG